MDLIVVTRVLNSLKARRKQLGENEKGFTLIELLVVVIIIGILAAIAIPVYMGIQDNAKDSAIKSDLANAKTAVVAFYTADPTAATAPVLNTDLGTFGYSPSGDVKLAYGATGTPTGAGSAFCIDGTRTSSTTAKFKVTESGGVVSGSCP